MFIAFAVVLAEGLREQGRRENLVPKKSVCAAELEKMLTCSSELTVFDTQNNLTNLEAHEVTVSRSIKVVF